MHIPRWKRHIAMVCGSTKGSLSLWSTAHSCTHKAPRFTNGQIRIFFTLPYPPLKLKMFSFQYFVVLFACAAFAVASPAASPAANATLLDKRNAAGNTCRDWAIIPGTASVSASCADSSDNGNPVQTSINLGKCIGNDNGVMYCQVK